MGWWRIVRRYFLVVNKQKQQIEPPKTLEKEPSPTTHVINFIFNVTVIDNKTILEGDDNSQNVTTTIEDSTVTNSNLNSIIDSNLGDVVNTIDSLRGSKSPKKTQIAEELHRLHGLVAELSKMLPPETAQEVSEDLKAFANEAAKDLPRKKWYELSGKGLVDAAKTVSEMAAPVASAVHTILDFLNP